MLLKKFRNGIRDRRLLFLQVVCPVAAAGLAMLLLLIKTPSTPHFTYDVGIYKGKTVLPYSQNCMNLLGWEAEWDRTVPSVVHPSPTTTDFLEMAAYGADTYYSHLYDRFSAVQCSGDPSQRHVALFYNSSSTPSVVLTMVQFYHQLMMSGMINAGFSLEAAASVPFTLSTSLLPENSFSVTPYTKSSTAAVLIALILVIPFTFLPATPAGWVVKERECKARHMQRLAGLTNRMYWVGNFVFDMGCYLLTEILVILILVIFRRTAFVGSNTVAPFCVALLLYGVCSTLMGYALSFLFSEHTSAQHVVAFVSFGTGFILLIVMSVLDILSSGEAWLTSLRFVCRVFPSFCVGDVFMNLAYLDIGAKPGSTPWSMDVVGWPCVFMVVEVPLFAVIVLLVEHPQRPSMMTRLQLAWLRCCCPALSRRLNEGLDEELKDGQITWRRSSVTTFSRRSRDHVDAGSCPNIRKMRGDASWRESCYEPWPAGNKSPVPLHARQLSVTNSRMLESSTNASVREVYHGASRGSTGSSLHGFPALYNGLPVYVGGQSVVEPSGGQRGLDGFPIHQLDSSRASLQSSRTVRREKHTGGTTEQKLHAKEKSISLQRSGSAEEINSGSLKVDFSEIENNHFEQRSLSSRGSSLSAESLEMAQGRSGGVPKDERLRRESLSTLRREQLQSILSQSRRNPLVAMLPQYQLKSHSDTAAVLPHCHSYATHSARSRTLRAGYDDLDPSNDNYSSTATTALTWSIPLSVVPHQLPSKIFSSPLTTTVSRIAPPTYDSQRPLTLHCSQTYKFPIATTSACHGQPAQYAQGRGIDLITIGTHGELLRLNGEDSDVEDERLAVRQDVVLKRRDPVQVLNVRKVYPGGVVAVRSLSFSVMKGEVFALLGTNGSGKTTTMSMLCQEQAPTRGKLYVDGHHTVRESEAARQRIGYCPQFDATLDLLTVREHLELYADIHGVVGSQREGVVTRLMEVCGITAFGDVLSKDLSGGNRRKLSVAMCLIGGPSVVCLDEPSAGMDPLARRKLWESILTIAKQCSVLLTTHHMEEVEALANCVGIMSRGTLRCLGDLQHLKRKYGSGYEVSLRVSRVGRENTWGTEADEVEEFVARALPGCVIDECFRGERYVLSLPAEVTVLSKVFEVLQENQERLGITDFIVSQTSIEQVFLRFCGSASEEDLEGSMAVLVPVSAVSAVGGGQRVADRRRF